MIKIMVGDIIPLVLKVRDGNEKLNVKAIVSNNYGEILKTVELINSGRGLYQNFDVQMPDCKYLIAEYFTNDPEKYEEGMDIFKAIPKPIPEENYLLGEVVSVQSLTEDDSIIGEVVNVEKEM
jgi:hypothetical protein